MMKRTKQLLALVMAVVMCCVLFAGCGLIDLGGLDGLFDGDGSEGDSDASFDVVGFWETKYNEDSYFNPQITFNKDHTFEMRFNLLEGFGTSKGTYEIKGDRVYCYVESRTFSGYTNAEQTEYVFRYEDGVLIYESEFIGMTNTGDRFER